MLVISSCSYSSSKPEALEEAQRLMASDPGAALSKLNSVDVANLQDSATMAQWALLYSEALVVNRLSAPTDTIVNIAVNYYGHHHMNDEFQRASRLKALMSTGDNRDELATALYLQKEKEYLLYKERMTREKYLFVCLLLLVIAGAVIIWMRQRLKLQNARNDTLMAIASGMRCQISEKSHDLDRLETTLHDLLADRFTLIDSLCQTYYESQGTKNERKAIIDKVKSEIEAVRTDSFPAMEKAVNECRGNLLTKVRKKYKEIKPDEYQLLVYIASGLSTRTICLLLGLSQDTAYKRKSRLKSRLTEIMGESDRDISALF